MKILDVKHLGVIQEAHIYTGKVGSCRAEEASLIFYTDEGCFLFPCSSLERLFKHVQVDEYDPSNDIVLAILP